MPYIKPEERARLEKLAQINTTGELNYLLTQLIKRYLETYGNRYSTYNDILGALEGAKLEFYRRVVAPYEDDKIKLNGDVY